MPSSRQTPTIAPRPTNVDDHTTSPPAESKTLNARILKKREADRKCQRMIRERTKSRIAYLEEMVEEFKRKDTSGQVETLMQQLTTIRQERDVFAKKVKNIESVLTDEKTSARVIKVVSDGSPEPGLSGISGGFFDKEMSAADGQPFLFFNNAGVKSLPENMDGGMQVNGPIASQTLSSLSDAYGFDATQDPEPAMDNVQPMSPVEGHIAPESQPNPSLSKTDQPCECSIARQSFDRRPPFNIWIYVNEVLSSRFRWPTHFNSIKDHYRDDVPVRVVVEGWEAVERRAPLHPAWQVLKKIDQAIFWRCSHKERLAALHTMYVLFESHSNPSSERAIELPGFFSQGPGIRRRFFENQHRYCTNNFWTIFTRNFRVLWPFEFRDCYMKDTESGLYRMSPTFQKHISNIDIWAMGSEMFDHWPEFRVDIPSYNSIPASMSNKTRYYALPTLPVSHVPKTYEKPSVPQQEARKIPDQRQTQNQQLSLVSSGQVMTDLHMYPLSTFSSGQVYQDLNWPQVMPQQMFVDADYQATNAMSTPTFPPMNT